MRFHFQPEPYARPQHLGLDIPLDPHTYSNIYREFEPKTYVGVNGLGTMTIEQLTASAGTAAGSATAMLTPFLAAGSAIPLVGAFIGAAAGIAILIEKLFSGCGQTCVETSNAANQAANLLVQNVQNYVNAPVRTQTMQAAALAVFDQAWAWLLQVCNNPQFGAAGQACIADRQQGACHYKTSPGGWVQNADGTCTYTWAGANGSGSTCWNWFSGMRDPIANDPCVVPDSTLMPQTQTQGPSASPGTIRSSGPAAGGSGSSLLPSTPASILPWVLIGGGLLLLVAVES